MFIGKTKLDSSYPDLQLKVLGYQNLPYSKNWNKNDGGKIVLLQEGLIARRLKDFEGDTTEVICLELTVCKKIWFIIFAYRPTFNNNFSVNSKIL